MTKAAAAVTMRFMIRSFLFASSAFAIAALGRPAGAAPIDRPGVLPLAFPLFLGLAGPIAVGEGAGPGESLAHDLVGIAGRTLRRVHALRRSRRRSRRAG